jgi:hypothetical protein
MRLTRLVLFLATSVIIVSMPALLRQASLPARADELTPQMLAARTALEKYQDPFTAIREGFFSTVGCVSFTTASTMNGMPYPAGAMGVHFINMQNVGPKLDPARPQVLLYAPTSDGKLKLAGAEWFMPYQKGMKAPILFGHKFYGPMMGHWPVMPKELVHYDLHVWLWAHNPNGEFSPTNSAMKCPSTGYNFANSTPDMAMPE